MQAKRLRGVLTRAGMVIGGLAVGVLVVLPLGLPFFLAYGLSLAAEGPVGWLQRKTPLPRWACTALGAGGLFVLLGAVVWFFARVLFGELRSLAAELPGLLENLRGPVEQLRAWLDALAGRLPPELGRGLEDWVGRLLTGGSGLAQGLAARLTGLVSRLVAGLPGTLLTLGTTVVATFLFSAGLPEIQLWLRRRLPPAWRKRLIRLRAEIHGALGGYLRAQLKMMGIVFGVLTLGLWALGVEFPLLFGGLIALMDALPVLGTGTVLVPWALVGFLQGDRRLGLGLLALYGLSTLARTCLEPRVVGRQLGLHPLVTLAAFYVGYRLLGVAGMILLPICAILTRQLLTLRVNE